MNYVPAMGYAPHSGRGRTATKDNIWRGRGGRVLGRMAWGSGRGAFAISIFGQREKSSIYLLRLYSWVSGQ